MKQTAFITHGSESAAFWQFNILWQMMATGMQTSQQFALMDEIFNAANVGPTTHTHTQDEGLYIISGSATFNAGGNHGIVAGPGTFVAIPANTEHSFKSDESNTRMLNFYLPAGFEMFLMGVAKPAETREPPPPEKFRDWLPARWVAAKLNKEYGTTYKFGAGHTGPPNPDHYLTEATPGARVFPVVANINDGKRNYHFGNALWGVLVSSEDTGGSYSLFELRLRKGSLYAPRIFTDRDTAMYVLTGSMSFFLGGRPEDAEQGSLVWIPRGTMHSIQANSETASCLYLQTPGGIEKYIELVGTQTEETSAPLSWSEEIAPDAKILHATCESLGLQEILVADPLSEIA